MSREDFDPNHPHGFMTRDGRTVRVLTLTEGSAEFPIVGFVEGDVLSYSWNDKGLSAYGTDRPCRDLINAPPPKGWLIVADGKIASRKLYPTREAAMKAAPDGAFAMAVDEIDGDPCERCCGTGEIITDWDRYLKGQPGDTGDEGTADCPDCDGRGQLDEDGDPA